MKATGVVVEYNPFHNGHLHHIKQSRQHTEADLIIAVMSGHFLQRGEPAFVDKWYRTNMALASGADLVVELPYVYSTAQASDFAKGAIHILEACGCEYVSFGSEQGEIEPFLHTYELLKRENNKYQELVQEFIQTGVSYPSALSMAYEKLASNTSKSYADLTKPNNILGYHYLEAAKKMGAHIKPATIQRIQAGYHEEITNHTSIASATGIRKAVMEANNLQAVNPFLPESSISLLQDWYSKHHVFGSWQAFWPLLQFSITRMRPSEIALHAEVTEGIEYKLLEAAKTSSSFESFMQKVKSKRYTWTRIQRMLTHIFTGFTWEQLQSFQEPTYIRLLGMNDIGQTYLSKQKKKMLLPVISRAASMHDDMLALDFHATDMYMLGIQQHEATKNMGRDFQIPPIRR